MRLIDANCSNATCRFQYRDKFFVTVPDIIVCPCCHFPMTQLYLPRPRAATQWHESESVVVYRNPKTGKYRFPGRNDQPTPAGYERVVARSDRELGAIEKASRTLNERRWFDGNGRGFDDKINGDSL